MAHIPENSPFKEEIFALQNMFLEFIELEKDMWIDNFNIEKLHTRLETMNRVLFENNPVIFVFSFIYGICDSVIQIIERNMDSIRLEKRNDAMNLNERFVALKIMLSLMRDVENENTYR